MSFIPYEVVQLLLRKELDNTNEENRSKWYTDIPPEDRKSVKL